jgi:hypothetical protein
MSHFFRFGLFREWDPEPAALIIDSIDEYSDSRPPRHRKYSKAERKRYRFPALRVWNLSPNWIGSVVFSSYDYIGWVRTINLQIMIIFCGGSWLRTNVLNFNRFSPNILVLVSKTPKILQNWRETISLPGSQSLKFVTELNRISFIFKLWLHRLG